MLDRIHALIEITEDCSSLSVFKDLRVPPVNHLQSSARESITGTASDQLEPEVLNRD
jgi:hypothetical protein